jgi:hypothetical protein
MTGSEPRCVLALFPFRLLFCELQSARTRTVCNHESLA